MIAPLKRSRIPRYYGMMLNPPERVSKSMENWNHELACCLSQGSCSDGSANPGRFVGPYLFRRRPNYLRLAHHQRGTRLGGSLQLSQSMIAAIVNRRSSFETLFREADGNGSPERQINGRISPIRPFHELQFSCRKAGILAFRC